MTLVAITITLTLHLSFGRVTSVRLDVNPLIGVPVALPPRVAGFTLPGVMIYNPDVSPVLRLPIRTVEGHELHHYRQEEALGPWFWVAYAATAGRAFEPTGALTLRGQQDWSNAWMPTSGMPDNYPLLRFDASGVHLLPGYF